MKKNHKHFLDLAFELARINLGKTKENPSVGCVVVKNNSVISSGYTSINGRPHAEYNALNKNINFSGSSIYITMEPCTHYGVTPPCTNLIKKKNIKNVYYSFYDVDNRTGKKSSQILLKNNIKTSLILNNNYTDFYQSYFENKKNSLPLVDGKIAISQDWFTINKKRKWITNYFSRKRTHLIRSEYDSILSTSKTINKDNALLNCRLDGFNSNKPDLIIIDKKMEIKTNLSLFNLRKKRKIIIITKSKKNKKINYLIKKGVKFIQVKSFTTKKDFLDIFKTLKNHGFNRILVESGLIFLKNLLEKKLLSNLFLFKSSTNLGINGFNSCSVKLIKKLRNVKKIDVNLYGDRLYKVKIK